MEKSLDPLRQGQDGSKCSKNANECFVFKLFYRVEG